MIPELHRAIRPLGDLGALRALRAAYRDFKPEIIHTHSSKAGILGRAAASAVPQASVVHTIHGMSFNRTQPLAVQYLYRALERWASRRTDHLVSVADAMTTQAVSAGLAPVERFSTINSGMQTEWFTPDVERRGAVRRAWGVQDDHVVVGTVARLFRNKGYEQLIPAMAAAAATDQRLRFVWIGDGIDRRRYLDEVRRLGLESRLMVTGLLPPREVADTMQGFDLLAHCSQWEGLPRSVAQALLLEIPAISFDIDGAGEVIRDGVTGLLVPLNDVDQLARAIVKLAAEPETRRRLGQAGRAHCLPRFDHHRMVDDLEALYHRLLETAKRERT